MGGLEARWGSHLLARLRQAYGPTCTGLTFTQPEIPPQPRVNNALTMARPCTEHGQNRAWPALIFVKVTLTDLAGIWPSLSPALTGGLKVVAGPLLPFGQVFLQT